METLINKYLKIEPVEHVSFIMAQKDTYEEMGKVVAVAVDCAVSVGSVVKFDSFMCKKYPRLNEEGKFDWYVHEDEVVSYTI